LDIALQEMVVNGIQNELWYLGSGCVVEKHELLVALEGGERCPNAVYGKVHRLGVTFGNRRESTHQHLPAA
jgi:hypothetical protein